MADAKKPVATVKTQTLKKEDTKAAKAPAKKAAPAKAEVKAEITVQYQDREWNTEDLLQSAKDVWVYDMKKDAADFKSVALYVKPEEARVYFIVNGTESGSFVL